MDSSRSGLVEVSSTAGGTSVRVERASIQVCLQFVPFALRGVDHCPQPDEIHIFGGKEEPTKDVECVLIYNEDDGVRHIPPNVYVVLFVKHIMSRCSL